MCIPPATGRRFGGTRRPDGAAGRRSTRKELEACVGSLASGGPDEAARPRDLRGPAVATPGALRTRPIAAGTVQDLAPPAVVVASGFRAARKEGRGRHRLVAGAIARWDVQLAPAYIED